MNTSKIIKAAVGGSKYTVTAPILKEDYGIILQIEGADLPESYQVDFSNDEHNGTSVTMVGNADGVLIPRQFIDTGRDVFAFLYWVGEDYGKTVYKFRIPNKLRPDRTSEEPTPEQQSVIDQAIAALNEAVEQTGQDAESASESAQSAKEDADFLRNASATATTLAAGSEATVDLTDGQFAFGIPRGEDAVSIQIDTDAVVIHTGADGVFTKNEIVKIHTAFYDGKTLKSTVPQPSKIKLKKNAGGFPPQYIYVDKNADVSYGVEHDVTWTFNSGWELYTNPTIIELKFIYNGATYIEKIPLIVVKDGAKGIKGDTGADGISPTVTITSITGGHRITITDADGEHSADVMDGHNGMVTEYVTGTTPTITAQADYRYVCGEVATLDFTPSQTGICDVVFTSGATATVLTVPSTIKWANGFDPTSLDANTTYELNIMDGLGVACAWA